MAVSLAALQYAIRGWRVFPLHTPDDRGICDCYNVKGCKQPGKHPWTKHGFKEASCDPAIIAQWWSQWPEANLGIATGAESGIVVLDVDPGHGGDDSLMELEKQHGALPTTPECITGGGGRHLYFRHPGIAVPNSASKVGPGIDIRGDGGYVVAPPSRHVSGRCYEWEASAHPDDTQLASMPAWLLVTATAPTAAPTTNGKAQDGSGLPLSKEALRFVAHGAPVGQQRATAIRAARSYLGAGYSVQDTADAIWRGLQASPTGDPATPWTYQDAEAIAVDLAQRPATPPAPLANEPDGGLPTIFATCPDLAAATTQCWAAIQAANDPPRYFRHGGVPARIEADDQGAPIIRELTADRLRHELARIARWRAKREAKGGTWINVEARPPLDVMKDILATPNAPLPVLTRIVEVPVFAADGTLQTTAGYHPAARTYYQPAAGLDILSVPDNPSGGDVEQARQLILTMIQDFPFVADADRAGAVALLLLPFVRDMIHGPTPNHLVEAPSAGSGKGLLADVLLMPSVGGHVGVVTQPRDEDELRKRLTSQFREGRAAVLLDNISQLDSGTLAAALTALTWDDRLLGKTEMLSLAVRCVWVTTANNPTMSTEIARRCVRIRLDPMEDRPWQREGFMIPNLRGWAQEHRAELVHAALVLVRSWLSAGRPRTSIRPLGSYEQWTEIIGGIVQHAGISGLLGNLNEFYEASDLEGAIWRQFVAAWFERHAENEVGTADLFPLAQASDLFDLGKGGERSQRISFGKQLGRQRDRVIGEYRITRSRSSQGKTASHKAGLWKLLPVSHQVGHRGMWGILGDVSPVPPCEGRKSDTSFEIQGVRKHPPTSQTSPHVPSGGTLLNLTNEWQEIPSGMVVEGGNGLEVRFDQTTNRTYARRVVQQQPPDWCTEPEPDYVDEPIPW